MKLGPVVMRHGRGLALAVALLVVAGAVAYARLPRGLYPELSFPRVAVVATLPDATAELVLRNVTRPLEEALLPLLGVRRVRSKTIRGGTELSLQFDPDTDMVVGLQLVQARLAEVRAELPAEAVIVAERVTPVSFPIYTLNVDGAPVPQLRDVALYQVRPALSRVPGVGLITVTAGEEREYEVEVDPARAEAAGLTLEEIAQRVGTATRFLTVGRLDHAYRRYAVVLSGTPPRPSALADLVVGGSDRVPVRLGDVARIEEGHSDARLSVHSPSGLAAVVNVARRIGGDTIELDAALGKAVEELRRQVPPGVRLTPVYQQAPLIADATSAVRDAILTGALLSAIIILLFLRDWRATLLAALVIPSSLLVACAAVKLFHGSLNLMSLGGMAIAVGLVIDDAVVVVEAIHRELSEGKSPLAAAEAGVTLLAGPVISSTLTTIVVFAPLAFLSGVVGAFFSALALSLSAAVVASLVIALTIVPMLSASFSGAHSRAAGPPAVERERLAERYAGWLRWALGRRRGVLAVTLVVVVAGVVGSRFLDTGFIPELDEGAYVFDYYTPIGTSLAEADVLASELDDMLRKDPDVQTFTRRLGSELGPPRATETSRGDLMVRLKHGHRPIGEVMTDQREQIASRAPGVRVELLQLLQDMLGDLEGNPEPIELKIFGDDEPELRRQAKRVAEAIADVPGLTDLFDGQVACSPQRVVVLDPMAVGRVGLSTDAIAMQIGAVLLGAGATPLPDRDRLVPVRIRWPDGARFDERALERIRVRAPGGAWVPLVELGRVEDDCAPSELVRENLRLMVPVTARLEGRDLGSAALEVERRLLGVKLPRGYTVEIGGQRVSQQESFRALGVALAAAVALVLLVLVFQFGEFAAPVAILAATPVALAGGVAALLATHVALNVSSLLGSILLVGLVVKNGILLLHRARQREDEGHPLEEALREAGEVRLRPILMTTLCTLVGLVPLALGLGAGSEMHRPLAVAVIGGLTVSTAGTLFVVPAVYAALRRKKATGGASASSTKVIK